ncbi:hypothetical protein [Komagataeibacter sp. FNDCF1]|nr:hypothetical protein [Komagataeibacter sp. FNDCF1]
MATPETGKNLILPDFHAFHGRFVMKNVVFGNLFPAMPLFRQ